MTAALYLRTELNQTFLSLSVYYSYKTNNQRRHSGAKCLYLQGVFLDMGLSSVCLGIRNKNDVCSVRRELKIAILANRTLLMGAREWNAVV